MKIRPVSAMFFLADGQKDNMAKLIVGFRNFANVTNKN